MAFLRNFGLFLAFILLSTSWATALTGDSETEATGVGMQQLIETVDIQGNRRYRDEDLLYYIKTRPGDVYDPKALERDLKELLSLNFFDKSMTRVLVEDGVRGGVNVIFEVRELQVIRDLQFQGLKAVQESDVLKAFREERVGISKEAVYDPSKSRGAVRILKELLASKGYPNAKVTVQEEEVSATSTAITFVVDQGNRSRIVEIVFEGNEFFKDGELRSKLELVKQRGLISSFKGQDILDLRKLQYDLRKNVLAYMFSKGYFQARIGDPEIVGLGTKRTSPLPLVSAFPIPLLTSQDEVLRIVVPITEGKIFRVGELKVEGNSIFSEDQILSYVGLSKGEVANGKRLQDAVYEDLKKIYGSQGFVLYNAEFDPKFKDNPTNPNEGIVDVTITIEEGRQFRLRRLEFTGNTFTRDKILRREVLINEGDIYDQISLERSVLRLNQTQYFDPIDKDKDVEIRTDEEQGEVDLVVKVKERGRQQISLNGGVSGIGGTFFGLEYSTNNLVGRGETLSVQFGLGNRQQNFNVTIQEPYFRDRPISLGASLFASKYQFYGEGTFLSQNQDLINQIVNDPLSQVITNEENLFTQNTYGFSVFATAPLSELFFKKKRFTQFSRFGLSYQLSATTIKDPPINQQGNALTSIPIIYAQPNIITSRVTASFAYDTRQPAANGIDTLRGTQLSFSMALSGLLGDVRTYQPSLTYSSFFPIRRKNSPNAEVFGFRITAGTIGTFSLKDKIRNANSLSFVGGIPIYERYFLGSEFDLRGYDARSIAPIAPIDAYITTRNVVVANNVFGTPVAAPTLLPRDAEEIAAIGLLTGVGGNNPGFLNQNYRFIGGDTQLLGNFEYRIPIFGPASFAAFADIGTVFNLRKTGEQFINSNFLPDDTYVGAGLVTAVALRNNPNLESSYGSLLMLNNRVLTKTQFTDLFCRGNRAGCPVALPAGLQQLYLRGDAQTNNRIRIDESIFNKFGDFKASVGVELRVQVPVVNVPFRLIYFYNPNAKFGVVEEVPNLFFPGKTRGFKFSVGRTF
jgi:outer membrane protein insertion porin family